MKPWLFLFVAAVAGGIGGFILGKASSPGTEERAPDTVVLQNQSGGILGTDRGSSSSIAGSSGNRSTAERRNIAKLRQDLDTLKTDADPVNRFASLTRLLSDLSPENLDAVLQTFNEIPMRNESRQEYQMLMYAWAAFDPQGALKFVEENANSRSLNSNVLLKPLVSSWASNNPEETLEWLNSLPENERQDNNLLSGLMEGWAVKDPYAAAGYLQENVEPGKNREMLVGQIASHLFKQDPLEATKWAESHTDLKFREEAFEELAEDWASVNPKELASWLENHVDQDYSVEAFEDLARGWVSQDPEAATAYFENLPDGRAKESGIYEMAVTWGKDDLLGLGQWLNGLPDSDVTDMGVKAYVERLAGQAPEAAIQSAMSINTDEIRDEAVHNIGRQWLRQDPEAATAWAQANGVPLEAFQGGARQTVINGQVITERHFDQVTEALESGRISPDQLGEMMEIQARAAEMFKNGNANEIPPADAGLSLDGVGVQP